MFASLRYANYRYLWLGNLLNMAGFWIQQVTVSWLVWKLSGSAMIVGITAALRSFPFLLLGPLGGVAADRLDRRRMLIVLQLILAFAAVTFALLVALDRVRVWHAMVFSFVMGTGLAVNMPVRQALIANMVPRAELGNAIALNAVGGNASRIIGPAAGGVLILAFGMTGNFLLQAGLYFIMVAILFPMKVPHRVAGSTRKHSALASFKEGIRYVWNERTVLGLLMLSFIAAAFIIPILQILPVFTDKVLHAGADTYGYLVAAFGAGGLLATLIQASFGNRMCSGRLGITVLLAGCGFVVILAFSSHLWLSFALLAAIGFCQMTFRVNNNTLVLSLTPEELQGRVMSLYMVDHALTPFASAVLGVCADRFPVQTAMSASGILGMGMMAALWIGVRQVRELHTLRVQSARCERQGVRD
ncbi:MAG: MFS transporter [Deltaproteobacteria bacterium]|nr:MFS transporter [Deltaproteobacteria bacterium]